jgi:hypothetical protein
MADDPQPFRIRRAWLPFTLAVLCVLYFAGVLFLAATNRTISGVDNDQLALGGAALFVVTLLVQIPFFLRRRPKRAPAPQEEPEPMPEDMQEEPLEVEAPRMEMERWDDEVRLTTEQQQGMVVLEYSRPAKSRHRGAVYTKAYVPVTKEHVLRVETLAAEGSDL